MNGHVTSCLACLLGVSIFCIQTFWNSIMILFDFKIMLQKSFLSKMNTPYFWKKFLLIQCLRFRPCFDFQQEHNKEHNQEQKHKKTIFGLVKNSKETKVKHHKYSMNIINYSFISFLLFQIWNRFHRIPNPFPKFEIFSVRVCGFSFWCIRFRPSLVHRHRVHAVLTIFILWIQ